MLRISPGASVIMTLYRATGTAVRFSGISEFPKKIFKYNIYFFCRKIVSHVVVNSIE
jgi:hypothetical protein